MLLSRGRAPRNLRCGSRSAAAAAARQLLTEGFMLALFGGAAGLMRGRVDAAARRRADAALAAVTLVRGDARLDIFAATLVCTLSTLVFGLLPARARADRRRAG